MEVGKLTDRQAEKLEACKSSEEVLEFVKEEGIELSDEDLDAIAGGASWSKDSEIRSTGSLFPGNARSAESPASRATQTAMAPLRGTATPAGRHGTKRVNRQPEGCRRLLGAQVMPCSPGASPRMINGSEYEKAGVRPVWGCTPAFSSQCGYRRLPFSDLSLHHKLASRLSLLIVVADVPDETNVFSGGDACRHTQGPNEIASQV